MTFFQLFLSVFVYGVYSYIILLVTIIPFPLPSLTNFQGYDRIGLAYYLAVLILVGTVGFFRSIREKGMLFNVNFRFLWYAVIVQLLMVASWLGYELLDFDYFAGISWHISLVAYMVLYGISIWKTIFGKRMD